VEKDEGRTCARPLEGDAESGNLDLIHAAS